MHFKKGCMEFEVLSVDEIKLLLQSWHHVLGRLQEGNAISQRLTEHHLVNVTLDKRQGPEEMVILQLIAPPPILERLVDELKARGLACSSKTLIHGLLTRCRLEKKRD